MPKFEEVKPDLVEVAPANAKVLNGAGRSNYQRGNVVFLIESEDPSQDPAVLKVYRQRKSQWNDFWGNIAARLIEKKRGVTALQRFETEQRSLDIWEREGFRVPQRLDRPSPDWVGALPHLWLEYIEGPNLFWMVHNPGLENDKVWPLVRRLAEEHSRRHSRALELNEPLLLQEHPTTKHILVANDELITFDLEGGYLPFYSVSAAVAHEIASTLRSLWLDGSFEDSAAMVFINAYTEHDQLRQACREFFSSSLHWIMKRYDDRRRRKQRSKTEVMEHACRVLGIEIQ